MKSQDKENSESELTPVEDELVALGLWESSILRSMGNGGGGRGPHRYWAKLEADTSENSEEDAEQPQTTE